jgi:hypothetical protein
MDVVDYSNVIFLGSMMIAMLDVISLLLNADEKQKAKIAERQVFVLINSSFIFYLIKTKKLFFWITNDIISIIFISRKTNNRLMFLTASFLFLCSLLCFLFSFIIFLFLIIRIDLIFFLLFFMRLKSHSKKKLKHKIPIICFYFML